jgi:GDP-L-fucose synthase
MINKNSKIFIAGHNGLVGSAIYDLLKKKKFNKILIVNRKKLDLRNSNKVFDFFKKNKIEFVIICAAKVGGIMANSTYPTEFLIENIEIQNNILKASMKFNIKRVIFLGSSCIYPKASKTPIKEDVLLNGKLEKTNEAYGLAKITGIKLSEYMFKQYKRDMICLMPTNIYGINDNFNSFSSHVIPGMITKFINAKKNRGNVELLGTGKPLREFLYVDDLAEAIFLALKINKNSIKKVFNKEFPLMNVGSGRNISIKKLAYLIKDITNFKGKIKFNSNYPDGVFKKNLNSNKIRKLGWAPKIKLEEGLKRIILSKEAIN